MIRLLFLFLFLPTFAFSQLDYHYKSSIDSFEVRIPQKPEVREITRYKIFSRNYKSYEVSEDWYFQYDISYTRNEDGTPVPKVSEKDLPTAMKNYLRGIINSTGRNCKELYSKRFKYNGVYPGMEYKISYSLEEFDFFKEGFFVLKSGKFIQASVTYLPNTKINILRKRYKLFISSFKF